MARLARFRFKTEHVGSFCSKVYPPKSAGTLPRGRGALGRVCYREDAPKWVAVVQPVTGSEPLRGYGRTRNGAVREALKLGKNGVTDPELRTVREVAESTGIHKRTLAGWVTEGILPSYAGRSSVHLVRCQDVIAAANLKRSRVIRGRARQCR